MLCLQPRGFGERETGFQGMRALMGAAGDHPERRASHQAEANGGNCPFELRQRQNEASGAGRDRRGA